MTAKYKVLGLTELVKEMPALSSDEKNYGYQNISGVSFEQMVRRGI
jgi:hypothetical protein